MNTYVAMYRGKKIEVEADTSYKAQIEATKLLKARKRYYVIIMIAAKDGVPVIHEPDF